MSKISHYFKRRKALKLFADRFLFEPLRPLAPQPGQIQTPPPQPQTIYKPEVPQQTQVPPQPVGGVPVQPIQPAPTGPGTPIAPPQPTQIPVQQPIQQPVQAPLPPPPTDQIVRTVQPLPQAARDVINRRLT